MTRSGAAAVSVMARLARPAWSARLTPWARIACVVSAVATSWSGVARADECPIGSVEKTEDGQTWCEPTVCEADNQCPTGSICRPVALCVEVGTLEAKPLAAKTDAGSKLLARQRCGADKACPQKTTCSEKSRCMTRAQADKAGLLTASGAGGAATADGGGATSTSDAPKKACGCDVVGMRGGELGAGALAALGALAIAARRRRPG